MALGAIDSNETHPELRLGLEDRRAANARAFPGEQWGRIDRRARRPGPVVRAGAEVATRANEPAPILVGVVGSETDGDRSLIALGALEAIEHSAC